MGLVLLAVIVFDLMTAGATANPTVVTKAFGPLELNMTFPPRYGESRAMLGRQVATTLSFAGTTNAFYYCAGVRGALFENCNIPEQIPKVDGFCSLHLAKEWDVDRILYGNYPDENQANAPSAAPLLDFLGVSQMSTTNIFAWDERQSFMPLATAGQRPVFASAAETLNRINSPDFDSRQTVYLPLAARDEITVTNFSEAKITASQFDAQRIRLEVEAAAPSMVVVAQSFYHDWHASIDGRPVTLWPANYAFQAVEVPAGRHEVVLRYEDWAFRIGAILSALTLFGCLTVFLRKETERPL